jgi:quercetin dioxygenase-like cupin family protein
MHVTRIEAAPEYQAPNHFDMTCLRLQGREAGPAEQLWLGLSIIEPGGRTGLDPSPMEKHYVVLEGELTLVGELGGVHTEAVLRAHDSCRFAPGEKRQLINHGSGIAKVLLAMPLEPPRGAA